jgi:hypothetical protein
LDAYFEPGFAYYFKNEKEYFPDPVLRYGTVRYGTTPKIWSQSVGKKFEKF